MEKLFGEQDMTNENTVEGRKMTPDEELVYEYYISRYNEEIPMQDLRNKFVTMGITTLNTVLNSLAVKKKIIFLTDWTSQLAVAYECYECNTRMTLQEFMSKEHADLHIGRWLDNSLIMLDEHEEQLKANSLEMNTLENIKKDPSRTNRSRIRNGF